MSPKLPGFFMFLLIACFSASCIHQPPSMELTSVRATCRDDVSGATIRWERPDGVDERQALDFQCATVGPAVVLGLEARDSRLEEELQANFGLKPSAFAPSALRRDRLVVVSWNTHVGGGDLPSFVSALRHGDFTDGEPVSDFVLLLQEVHRSGADVPSLVSTRVAFPKRIATLPPSGERIDIMTAARALGLSLFYAPSMRNGQAAPGGAAEDRGNAILSTLPLSNLMAVELPFERQRRVALAATVNIGGGLDSSGNPWRLRVATSHLDASTTARRLWVFASRLRARQAGSLARAFDDGVPTVLGSDLNTWSDGPREAAVDVLLRAFPDTPRPPMRPTFRAGVTQLALDYVMFRLPEEWRFQSRRLEDRFGSDHFPIMAELARD